MKIRGRQRTYNVQDDQFSGGGNATLFRVRGEDLVFKRYKKPLTDHKATQQIEDLCETGRQILVVDATPHGDTPVSSINWPLDLVSDPGGALGGVILPAIPSRFYLASGQARTLDFLLLARANPPAAKIRVPVLFRLTEILNRLDKDHLVHGDLSAKNVVWCAGPEPGAYLIDCDGLHHPRDGSPHPSFTAGWTDPRLADGLIPEHDERSDRYALALAMYRGLLLTPGHLAKRNGRWQAPKDLPPKLDEPIRRYITRGLDPHEEWMRPTASQWLQALESSFISNGAWDTQRLAVLDRHAEAHRRNVRAQPRQSDQKTEGKQPRPTSAVTQRQRPVVPTPRPRPKQAPTPHTPAALSWFERRHGTWARFGLALLTLGLAAGLIHAGNLGLEPALTPIGLLLGAAAIVASVGTSMWRDFSNAKPAVQWTATGVLAVGEGTFWIGTAAIATVVASVLLSLALFGIILGALFDD